MKKVNIYTKLLLKLDYKNMSVVAGFDAGAYVFFGKDEMISKGRDGVRRLAEVRINPLHRRSVEPGLEYFARPVRDELVQFCRRG